MAAMGQGKGKNINLGVVKKICKNTPKKAPPFEQGGAFLWVFTNLREKQLSGRSAKLIWQNIVLSRNWLVQPDHSEIIYEPAPETII